MKAVRRVLVEDQLGFNRMTQAAGTAHQPNRFFSETATFANREIFSAKGEELRQV